MRKAQELLATHRMLYFAVCFICVFIGACSHVSPSAENYDGVPATQFNYRDAVYRAHDIPASGMLLLSRSRESGRNHDQHDIDAAARAYFSGIGRPQCLILAIEEKGADRWEIKYSCQLQ